MFFNKDWQRFRKKFYRRTALLTFLCYASILNAVQDDEILGRQKQFRFLGRGPGQHLSKPFSPYVKVLSSSEVQVWWLPVITHGGPFTGRYELFIGDEMEYVGHDLEYIAKRLKPGYEYSFKIRACGVELGTCSDFSFPRYATTDVQPRFGGRSGSALTGTYLGKRRIFLIILTAILGPIAVVALMISVFLFFRYMCFHLRHTPCLPQDTFDPELQFPAVQKSVTTYANLPGYINQFEQIHGVTNIAFNCSNNGPLPAKVKVENQEAITPAANSVEPKSHENEDGGEKTNELQQPEGEEVSEKDHQLSENSHVQQGNRGEELWSISSSSSSDEEKSEESNSDREAIRSKQDAAKSHQPQEDSGSRSTRIRTKSLRRQNKDRRARSRTLSESEKCWSQTRVSSSDVAKTEQVTDCETGSEQDKIVVVVDNSNIFIGGRETACAENPGLKQRHVKLRLHALVKALERRRPVTLAFAGGSSPPGNPLIWDVYRRLGYVVDLEDRRGKDEQRVDELLHLSIYKALVELPPHTLVLATGDGSKGKGSGETSFPKCAEAALDQGWKVEVHSWKHCLSAEWMKIAAKHGSRLKIHYLDEHLHDITFVEYKPRRLTGGSHEGSSNSNTDAQLKQLDALGHNTSSSSKIRT